MTERSKREPRARPVYRSTAPMTDPAAASHNAITMAHRKRRGEITLGVERFKSPATAEFYRAWFEKPRGVRWILHAMMAACCACSLVCSLHDNTASREVIGPNSTGA